MLSALLLAAALLVHTPNGGAAFDVKIAQTEAERTKGLQNVIELPDNEGMLFIFEKEGYEAFWMDQTEIPLALLFINSQWKIVDIKYGTPYSRNKIQGTYPYQYVLELTPAAVTHNKIRTGQRVSLQPTQSP